MYAESRQPVQKLITPKDAEEFLAINNFPGQRKYNVLKGRFYADNMDAGTHRRVEIAVCRVKETNVDFLVNGQHNCQAIIMHGKPYPGTVSYYACDTMEEAWRLFATFDVHASRTERQFMGSRRGIFENESLRELPLRTLQCCGSALFALGSGTAPVFERAKNGPKTDKADLVEKYHREVEFAARFGGCNFLMSVGVVAAIIATFRKNAKEAETFWKRIENGAELKTGSPELRLRNFLNSSSKVDGLPNGRMRAQALFSTCVIWWNTYRTGEKRTIVKVRAMKTPPKVAP